MRMGGGGVIQTFISSGPDPSYVFPLDTWPGATAAFSLRKLRVAYAGSAIQLQRVDNGAVQDIGFLPHGNLDLVAAANFLSGTTGTCKKWYDQSLNNNNDFVPIVPTSQFQFAFNAGRAVLRNFSARGIGIGGMKAPDATVYKTSNINAFVVLRMGLPTTANQTWFMFGYPNSVSSTYLQAQWCLTPDGEPDFLGIGANNNSNINAGGFAAVYRDTLWQYDLQMSDGTIRQNGMLWGTLSGVSVTYPNSVGLYIGNSPAGSNSMPGDFAEFIVYGVNQASRNSISANQSSYWGIINPPPSVSTSDGFTWRPIYGGNFGGDGGAYGGLGPNGQVLETVNGHPYYTESAWNSYSLWNATNGSNNAGTMYRTEVHTFDQDPTTGAERSELDGAAFGSYPQGTTVQCYFSILIEPGLLTTGQSWWILNQSHYTNATATNLGTHVLKINSSDHFGIEVEGSGGSSTLHDLGLLTRGIWYHFFWELFASQSPFNTDTLKVWQGTGLGALTQVLNLGPANLFGGGGAGGTDPTYPKFGQYRGNPGDISVVTTTRHVNMQHSNKAVTDLSGLITSPPADPSFP